MPRINIGARVGARDPAAALRQVVDYERWADASDSIHSVRVEHRDDGSSSSFWEVAFRKGLMRWSEHDWLDAAAGRATFELIEGDPDLFRGSWTVATEGADCLLSMEADFDLGMPSLSHILDPIAVEAVEDAVASVLRGLFGEHTPIVYGEAITTTTPMTQGGNR
jgi:coenzyme Q-binding protein COQ10